MLVFMSTAWEVSQLSWLVARLSLERPGFNSMSIQVGLRVDKVGMRQISPPVPPLSVNIIPFMLHTQISLMIHYLTNQASINILLQRIRVAKLCYKVNNAVTTSNIKGLRMSAWVTIKDSKVVAVIPQKHIGGMEVYPPILNLGTRWCPSHLPAEKESPMPTQ